MCTIPGPIVRRVVGWVATMCSVLALVCEEQPGRADTTLDTAIRTALRENAAALTPIQVIWSRTRSSHLPLTELLQRINEPQQLAFCEPYEVQYIRQGTSYYALIMRRWKFPDGAVRTSEAELSFDGKDMYTGTGLELTKTYGATAGLSIMSLKDRRKRSPNVTNALYDLDYFKEAGFEVPTTLATLLEPSKSLILSLLENGAKVVTARHGRVDTPDGTVPCFILECRHNERLHRFYLDGEKNYTILGRDEEWSGKVACLSRNSSFIRLPTGLWMPRRSHVNWHTWPTMVNEYSVEPLLTVDIEVSQISQVHVPDERFVLKYDVPGTAVADGRIPGAAKTETGQIQYEVPANPDQLDKAIEVAKRGRSFTPESRWTLRVVMIMLAIGTVTTTVGIVLWYRARIDR